MVEATSPGAGTALLAGRGVIVCTPGSGLGEALARGLRRHGARVVELGALRASREAAAEALAEAARDAGAADLVVFALAAPAALRPRALADTPADDWHTALHGSMLTTLHGLQAVQRLQREAGGAVVVIGPSTALVGAAGWVPLMTLAEAQRTLVKSAARQWGRHGMRLNWIGIAARHYAPGLVDTALPQVPELGPPPPALGRVPEPQADVADAIAWLGSDGARGLTGASFNLDGGDWMVP